MSHQHDHAAHSAHENAPDIEIFQTHIYNPDREFVTHAEIHDDDPSSNAAEGTALPRALILSEGSDIGTDYLDGHPFALRGLGDGISTRTVWPTAHEGIAYFLHALEAHGEGQESAYAALALRARETDLDLPAYFEWEEALTPRDRQLRLLDLLDFRVGEQMNDWAARPYLETGTWRSTTLSASGASLAERITEQLKTEGTWHPHFCYRNTQRAIEIEQHNHRVEYAEGIALPTTGGQATRHAWLEIDGEVAEITWPWHTFAGSDAVYFGTTYPTEDVVDVYQRRGGGTQVALSDEDAMRLQDETELSASMLDDE